MSISAAAAAKSAGRSRRSARSPARIRSPISPRCRSRCPGGRKVRLDELGTVTDGAAEPRTFTRLFDEPIVAFGVTRAKGASDVTVDEKVAARLAQIQAAHPEIKFSKVDTQVDNELGSYHSTMETLIEGALLAVVVVFIFLRDLRATIVTAHRDAAFHHPDLLDDGRDRLLAQSGQPARDHAGDRHSRRRRDRRDREHRAPHEDGQVGVIALRSKPQTRSASPSSRSRCRSSRSSRPSASWAASPASISGSSA